MSTKATESDKFGLNGALAEVLDRMNRYQLIKTYTKCEYSNLSFQVIWTDAQTFRLVVSLTTDSKKPVFKGDTAYSLSGYVYVKFKEALEKDEARKPEETESILSSLKGREVRVNEAVVFSA
jgi:hypothetical protein